MATVIRTQKRPNIGASLAVGLEKKYQSEKEQKEKIAAEDRAQEDLLEREDYKLWAQAFLSQKTVDDFKTWVDKGKPLVRTPGEELEAKLNQAMIDYINARDSGKDTLTPLKRIRTLQRMREGKLTVEEEAARIKDEREFRSAEEAKRIAAEAANLNAKIEAQKDLQESAQKFERTETTRKLVWQDTMARLASDLNVKEGKELAAVKKDMLVELEDMKLEREKEIAKISAGAKVAEGFEKRLAAAEMELNKAMLKLVEKDIKGGKTVTSALQGFIDRVNRLRSQIGIPQISLESGSRAFWPDAQWSIVDPAGVIMGNEPAKKPDTAIIGPAPGVKGSGFTPVEIPGA